MRLVLGVEDTELQLVPVNLNSEVVPVVRGELGREQDVGAVVTDLENVGVVSRKGTGGESEGGSYNELLGRMNEFVFRMRTLTDLEVENVSSVVRLNKYDLVFVRQVQRLGVVLLDGEVESGNTTFHLGQELGMFAIVSGDQVRTPEAVLGIATGSENGAVVDRD